MGSGGTFDAVVLLVDGRDVVPTAGVVVSSGEFSGVFRIGENSEGRQRWTAFVCVLRT